MIAIRQISVRFLVLLCTLLIISFVSGQEIREQIEVQLVQIDLVATNGKGSFITDLTAEDFVVKEEGKVQNVTHFYNSATEENRYPLTISFVVDTSYSMGEKVAGLTRIEIAAKAADLVMNQVKEQDQVELIEFNSEPKVIVPFTSDVGAIRDKFSGLSFQQANTAMHDSVVFAVERINEQSGRKVVVIFSDGMDSASKGVEEDVVEALKKSDATLIAFYSEFSMLNFPSAGGGLGGNPSSPKRIQILAGEDALRRYTEMTGGQFFSFRKELELSRAIGAFRDFIRSQYTLAYTPSVVKKGKAEWRKIKVECKRKGVKLQHRDGYWAG
jgi:VWFA-related protein